MQTDPNQDHVASVRVKNEVTQEWVIDGSMHLGVDRDGSIEVKGKSGFEDFGFYQFDNSFEYYLSGETGVTIYDDKDLTGDSIELFRDMADLGHFNLKMDSVDIPKNWIVRFYEGKNYTGGYYSRGWTLLNQYFDEMDFEPRVQSMRIITVYPELETQE